MRGLSILALLVMVIGALNWGLVGVFGFNLVSWLFGPMTVISRIVYILVGLAGLFGIAMLWRLSETREDICVPGRGAAPLAETR